MNQLKLQIQTQRKDNETLKKNNDKLVEKLAKYKE